MLTMHERSFHVGCVTVLIADAHAHYREGLARAIGGYGDLELVYVAAGGEEAFEMILRLQPEIALLDLRMPDLDGLEVCRRVKAADPEHLTSMLLCAGFATGEITERARLAGAAGIIDKGADRADICEALARLAAGV